jgi:hypothetical protein
MAGLGTALLAAGTIASAGVAAYSAYNASQAEGQAQGMSQATFGEQQSYAQQLNQLMANPSSVTSLPGYSFNFGQGADAVAREMAASGFAGSGNEAIALTQYGQNYAQSAYQQQEQMLAQLSGLTAASSPAQYQSVGLAAGNQSFNQLGQSFASLGYGLGQFDSSSSFTPADMQIMASGGPSSTMQMGGYTVNTPWGG